MKKYPILKGVIFLLNILVAILLAMVLLASFIPPSEFAVFSIIALIYPILLFTNVFFIGFWILFKNKYWLISFILIILGFNNLRDNFQFNLNGNYEKSTNDFKIVTYNVQLFSTDKTGKDSDTLKNDIVEFLKEEQANIICLQEYHSMDRNVYLPLIDLSSNLLQNSYYYESYFNPRFDQLSGLVIFSKFKAVNKGKLKFSGSRTFGIYTDLIISNDTVRVFNIHLASIRLQKSDIGFVLNPDFNDSKVFRNKSANIYTKLKDAFLLRELQMKNVISEINRSPYPVILCGDFNDTPSSYIYALLNNHLTDSFVKKGNKLSRTYAGNIPYLRIDYIFTSQHFKVSYFERVKRNYSDHYPVISIISVISAQ